MGVICTLLEEYFDSVHWFSLVIYESRFRSKFATLQDGLAYPSQKAFLRLLSLVAAMGAWYKSHKNAIDSEFPDEDWLGWSTTLVDGVAAQLIEIMDQVSISALQLCILLGSYYVYHGKPNLSFALLGATIRTAHAMGLHYQPRLGGDVGIIEERKRVWWTIYTWDRFASVTYGRPLGINDKDCSVTQPIDLHESPYFKRSNPSLQSTSICYSSYQRELNKLYLIASPIIEIVFGLRAGGSQLRDAGPHYMQQITEVTEKLWLWQRRLPAHLLLNLHSDCEPNPSRSSKVHQLQALSLQLTFDSLLIIFHRPLLAQQVEYLIQNRSEGSQGSTKSPSVSSSSGSSHFPPVDANTLQSRQQTVITEHWWDAALRTSRVTEMPRLAQLATDSHLVAFLGINLFNSAVVMAVIAFSDPLSDRAQDIKRAVTRIFRLQEVLGKRSQLSMQSTAVLRDVIQMLLRREADAMLGDITPVQSGAPTVEDALRFAAPLPWNGLNDRSASRNQSQYVADRIMGLDESLASLQRVFPTANDTFANSENTSIQHGAESINEAQRDFMNEWSQTDQQNFDNDELLGTYDDAGLDTVGNDLYWFWDTNWINSIPERGS